MTIPSNMHKELQEILSKEIALRQEILGNMSQQEYLLLIGDTELKGELYIECNTFVRRLKDLTKARGMVTRKLFDHLPPDTQGTTLSDILDPLVEIEGEALFLYEQIKELTDKIHGQHLRNKTLQEMISCKGPLSVDNEALHSETKPGKGPTLITIDYPPEKTEK
ncbi:hypothetical protein [Candidatus Neptunochlamydia vexilliferae]|uniref:hypothetical protein n=1 Tax=Candidatus Neptunichlamydia vexilliferae TaxID=1651774 RepID=UPI0018915E04|nr:hypothetical protein [Candidatus Neptunochlamydia vexilliferae]